MVYLLLLKFGDKSCEVISTIGIGMPWNAMVKVNQMKKMNVNIGFKCVEDMTILTTTVGTWTWYILDKFIL